MLNINRIMITGRLTRDPETKYLPSGQAITNLAIASNRNYQDKSGEWKEETMFVDIETWGKLAERCAETLKKGRPVYVEGRLKQDSWERDGVKQTKFRVSADMVKGFDVPQRGQGGPSGDSGGENYESEGGYSQSSSSRNSSPSGSNPQGSRNTGAPSDGLEFDGGSRSVNDDIPF